MREWFDKTTLVWMALMVMTALSWYFWRSGDVVSDTVESRMSLWTGVSVLLLSCFKVRLVILHFMGIQDAPTVLRGLCEAWTAMLTAMLVVLYLRGG
jgi:hypothetical protein